MLWKHGLERAVPRRTVIATVSALLLVGVAFIGVPRDAAHESDVAPAAANAERATPAAQLSERTTSEAGDPHGVAPPSAPRPPTPTPADPVFDPLPRWVESTNETVLWSASGDTATRLSTLPENSYLQVLGQPESGRLPVYLDGSNAGGPSSAWVDAGDVRASDSPPRVVASSRGGSRSLNPDISTPDRFISVVAEAAQDSQRATGVPASVTVAQAILESDWGKSLLASKAFNFFGIKAQTGPGPAGVVNMDTWEVLSGASTVVDAAFKAYHNVFESVDDHGRFLRDNPRYSAAFHAAGDAREFARRINAAGYATDPAYSSKLIRLMDKYNLYRYDLPIP